MTSKDPSASPIDAPVSANSAMGASAYLMGAIRLTFGAIRKSIAAPVDSSSETDNDAIRYGYLAMGCDDDVVEEEHLAATPSTLAADADSLSGRRAHNDNHNDAAVLREAGDDAAVVIGLALRHIRISSDVPFAIICALHRHAAAGNGAASATFDMLRRRAERRQRARLARYQAMGLRARGAPAPASSNLARLTLVGDCNTEAGR